ncbi:MAG: hypothetical protein LC791_07145 [Acidobacteria bacterium]|nr:hypothetical protein [Acidobacteriota bacterium]
MNACQPLGRTRHSPLTGVNYTGHISRLMHDIVARVPSLNFIDLDRVLVFARPGRTGADGPYASCHCLTLPDSDPGYFFWRDRQSGRITRRSDWFVTKSPRVAVDGAQIAYLISFAIPRFCDQSLTRSRKRTLYPEGTPAWVAKLDTVVHELYHIDPSGAGLRVFERADGQPSQSIHGPHFFEEVAAMVQHYLASAPDHELLEFLHDDFSGLVARYGGIAGLTFRPFPSYPRRYREVLDPQPAAPEIGEVQVTPLDTCGVATSFCETDLQMRQFFESGTRVAPAIAPPIAA